MKLSFSSTEQVKKRFSFTDVLILLCIIGFFYAIIELGKDMRLPLSQNQNTINLNPMYLPYYTGRSLLRMFIALISSFLFTIIYAKIAIMNRWTERIMMPIIDILQSIPVLGFLSITVTGFMALFPNSLFGVECAAIFAIFTGQVWNMTFSFYHSLRTIPIELEEFARLNQLSKWHVFTKLELPHGTISLVWNAMMSFGGGWFFLSASETITVLNNHIQLPGIGSYMATAINTGNMKAVIYAILTMITVIIVVDQLFWRPIVAWSQRFRNEQTTSIEQHNSWVLTLIKRAHFFKVTTETLQKKQTELSYQIRTNTQNKFRLLHTKKFSLSNRLKTFFIYFTLFCIGCIFAYYITKAFTFVTKVHLQELFLVIQVGFYTLLRVIISTLLGALWTIPVGVAIGFHPRLAKIAQPIVQILASFPATMTFPFLTILYVHYNINFELGAIPLMMLGTQWYILFNVIAGAIAIPSDLKEAALITKLTTFETWKTLILPGIFPYLVTGGITASGGAWNASIVAEIVSWKSHQLKATGLGAYIADATSNGNWIQIILGITVMIIIVVCFNRFFWRKLYNIAENKYHLN